MKTAYETIIHFGDCDEQGIVFYPRYFYWMDCGFHGLCRLGGYSQRTLKSKLGSGGTPLVKSTINFLSPATYEDKLVIKGGVARWGEKSFEIGYQAFVGDRQIFEGWETRVWLAPVDGKLKGTKVPDTFRTAMGEPIAKPMSG